MYLQKSLSNLNHKKGDFPVTDEHVKKIITFPCDQHLALKSIGLYNKNCQKFLSIK